MANRRPCPTCSQPINRGPGQHAYCSETCRPVCKVEGCPRPARGRKDICNSHEGQLRRCGELRPPKWALEWVCVVCGSDVPKGIGMRRHCSRRCQVLSGKNRPKSFDCVRCGVTVSLIVPSTKTGQFKRSDSKLCDDCVRQKKWPMTVGELAKRDGSACGICGETVELKAKDMFRPSVDHVIPRAAGGKDDPSNLQLAHLWCNQVKSKRADFSLISAKGA